MSVTRVTVNDRQAPPAPAPYGTEMARSKLGQKDPPSAATPTPPIRLPVGPPSGGPL